MKESASAIGAIIVVGYVAAIAFYAIAFLFILAVGVVIVSIYGLMELRRPGGLALLGQESLLILKKLRITWIGIAFLILLLWVSGPTGQQILLEHMDQNIAIVVGITLSMDLVLMWLYPDDFGLREGLDKVRVKYDKNYKRGYYRS